MAKLNKNMAKKVADAQDSFEPLEDGTYHARLRDVDTSREGPKGPYWVWEYEVVEAPYINRRLWNNTSLSDKALPILKRVFQAHGAGPDADTDELLGTIVKLVVGTRTIQEGDRKGEVTNQITRINPADPDFELPEEAKGGSEEKEEAIF